jgi:hypothetical protein
VPHRRAGVEAQRAEGDEFPSICHSWFNTTGVLVGKDLALAHGHEPFEPRAMFEKNGEQQWFYAEGENANRVSDLHQVDWRQRPTPQ